MAIGILSRHVAAASSRTWALAQAEASPPLRTVIGTGTTLGSNSNNVGCSYRQSSPRQVYMLGQRGFSSTPSKPVMKTINKFLSGFTDRGKMAVGMKTSEEKRFDKFREDAAADPAKGEKRRERRRWSRPVKVFDEASGEMREVYTEHKYSTARFRISPRKLQDLADQIGGGKPIDFAILQMQFSPKRAAKRIMSTLALARDHAVAKGLDASKLVVAEAWVGKGRLFKKNEFKGRGRYGIIRSTQSFLSIVLREGKTWDVKMDEKLAKEKRIVRSIGTGGVVRTNRPFANAHQRPAWQW